MEIKNYSTQGRTQDFFRGGGHSQFFQVQATNHFLVHNIFVAQTLWILELFF